ncbi:hypothetical protein [Hirschia litorea]|uniref:DUF4440 domain-containing protein n=1 Tax=Hirschia litorea TaxID=1199156 RepID=A0ABW2ILD2_9PROT
MTTDNTPQTPTISTKLENEIQDYFNRYAEAFSKFDFQTVSKMWSLPCLVTSNKNSLSFTDRKVFEENLNKMGNFGKSVGITLVQKIVFEIFQIAPETLSVRTRDTSFNKDGEAIVGWEQTYILQHIDDQWKAIATVASGEVTSWAAKDTPLAPKIASSDNILLD